MAVVGLLFCFLFLISMGIEKFLHRYSILNAMPNSKISVGCQIALLISRKMKYCFHFWRKLNCGTVGEMSKLYG